MKTAVCRFMVLCSAVFAGSLGACAAPAAGAEVPNGWAEIRVVDAATGRGVPLVELETVNNLKFVTDNAGRVAFQEPGLLGQEVFFTVRSHGYELPKDGFGLSGIRVRPRVGTPVEIRITRRMVAERLCRLTGEGLYRDSLLLGYKAPLAASAHPGGVAGQDSVQAALYHGRVYWFWGDTAPLNYPLGSFRTAGATSALQDSCDPAGGFSFDYFTDPATGFVRAMIPMSERPDGVVWVDGVVVVPDDKGRDRLICHYSRRKGLEEELEQGIALFDDDKAVFTTVKQLPLGETWRRPSGHPVIYSDGGVSYLLFGDQNPNVRVPFTLKDVLDPTRYEAFTCARATRDGSPAGPDLGSAGRPVWRWQKALAPTGSKDEFDWIKAGKLKPEHARFCPADALALSDRVLLHSGTVNWNEYRRRWVLIACQAGGKSSYLGEVWYSEALQPTGPFSVAVKVLTHDRQTFYNVCHHPFLDRDGGRMIYFEGTYTSMFSGNPENTPRYNYNQLLYRLDLEADAVRAARVN